MANEMSKERASLFDHPDVWGAGITERDGRKYLRVFVKQDTPEIRAFIPTVIDGSPASIEAGDPPMAL